MDRFTRYSRYPKYQKYQNKHPQKQKASNRNRKIGRKFEEFSLDFLRQTLGGNWYLYGDFPNKLDCNLPAQDLGVDLVGLDSKILRLVQCKYRSNTKRSIKYGYDSLAHLEAMGYRAIRARNTLYDRVELIVVTTAAHCINISDDIICYTDLMNAFQAWKNGDVIPNSEVSVRIDPETEGEAVECGKISIMYEHATDAQKNIIKIVVVLITLFVIVVVATRLLAKM